MRKIKLIYLFTTIPILLSELMGVWKEIQILHIFKSRFMIFWKYEFNFFLNEIQLIIIRCVKWTKAILEIIPNSLAFQIFHRNIITSTEQNCVLKSKIFLESHKLKGVCIHISHQHFWWKDLNFKQQASGMVTGSASGSASG